MGKKGPPTVGLKCLGQPLVPGFGSSHTSFRGREGVRRIEGKKGQSSASPVPGEASVLRKGENKTAIRKEGLFSVVLPSALARINLNKTMKTAVNPPAQAKGIQNAFKNHLLPATPEDPS